MVAKFKCAEKAVNVSSHYTESQINELEDQQELEKREKIMRGNVSSRGTNLRYLNKLEWKFQKKEKITIGKKQ